MIKCRAEIVVILYMLILFLILGRVGDTQQTEFSTDAIKKLITRAGNAADETERYGLLKRLEDMELVNSGCQVLFFRVKNPIPLSVCLFLTI